MMDFFRHLFFVFASSLGLVGVPLPLPLPPAPEDPALLRAAPSECLLFAEWFGAAPPAEPAKNRSERLAADPEVLAAVSQLVAATRAMIAKQPGDPGHAQDVALLFDLVVDAARRPGCVFVADLAPLAAGAALHLGDGAGAALQRLDRGMAAIAPPAARPDTLQVDGVEFRGLRVRDDEPFFGWAALDGYVVVAIGDAVARQLVDGLRNHDAGLGGNATLRRLAAATKVERPVLRTWAAVDRLAAKVEFAKGAWGPLGLDAITAALFESGLEGDGFVARGELLTPHPKGMLADLRGRPLSQDDLALIPDDATLALALRGADGSFERVLRSAIAATIGQDIGADFDEFLAQGRRQTGVDIRDDLIARADDCAVAWSSPRQGGLGFTGTVAAVPLRDGAGFAERLDAMWQKVSAIAPNKARDAANGRRLSFHAYLEQFTHGDRPAWWIDLIDRDMPFAFSWTSTPRHFLFGLLPQPLRCAMEQSNLPDFDHALVRTPLVARRGDAAAMLYVDLRGLLTQCYAPGLVLFQLQTIEWQREGFDFDLADVPRLQALLPHLGPELLVLATTSDGFRLTRRGSLPVFDPLLVTCGAACLLHAD